jgi:GNAT superfamily N-acetyltransferase
MKELLTEWRKFINENYVDPRIQKQMAALVDGGYAIEINSYSNMTRFKIIRLDYPRDEQRLLSLGYVAIGRSQHDDGKCLDAWSIYASQAKQNKGLGPLLYEIALEWSSQNGGGLMADRSMVSDEALSVWDKYYRTRPEIRAKQLDVDLDRTDPHYDDGDIEVADLKQLTPDKPDDDCQQTAAVGDRGDYWDESPLSKMYFKNNAEIMDTLEREGRLIKK